MISLEINIEELRKNKNFEEVAELTERLLDEVEKFENVTSGELIRIMAEKLEDAGYPLKEIREKIDERMHGKVSRQHISQSLDERFKNPKKVAAGRATREAHKQQQQQQQTNVGAGGMMSTVMVEPEFDNDNNDNDNDNDDDTEADVPDTEYMERKNLEPPFGTDDGAKLTVVRIEKMDESMIKRLADATSWSKTHTYLLIHPKTGKVEQMYSDVFYEKRFMQQKMEQ